MRKNITNNLIPKDLLFVINRNINAIAKSFETKYKQKFSKTSLQLRLGKLPYKTAEKLTREETFNLYKIEENNLFTIYKKLEENAISMGINITYVDMTVFSEDDHYENDENKETKHAETARSDGKNLLLEQDLQKAGGIQGRMYDLLHLAFGHMVQWSTDDKNMLLKKEEAWSIGYRNHENSPDIIIDMMSLYEFEAGMMAIEVLRNTMEKINIPENQKTAIIQYLIDYVYADRGYIIQHYRGNHESFQKFWKFSQNIPERQNIPTVKRFIKRNTVEIGLIKDLQK